MSDRWKYPFYVIAILLLVMWLFGCEQQVHDPFSVEVQVEQTDEAPTIQIADGSRTPDR